MTPFTDIYALFLNSITDYDMSDKMSEATFYDTLYLYLKKSISLFKECETDLSLITEPNLNPDEGDPIEYGSFDEVLTSYEIEILVIGMKLAWLDPKIYKTQLLKNTFDTKDLRTFSNSNLIDKLLYLKKDTQNELDKAISTYTYDGFNGFA